MIYISINIYINTFYILDIAIKEIGYFLAKKYILLFLLFMI